MCVLRHLASSSALITLDELSAHAILDIALTERDTAATNLHTAWVSFHYHYLWEKTIKYAFGTGYLSFTAPHFFILESDLSKVIYVVWN